MRVKVIFQFTGKLTVPVHHNELLHGLIFQSIRNEEYREQLHEVDYSYEKRQFRMFCFSRLQGQHTVTDGIISFESPVSFIFSTSVSKLLQEFVSTLFMKDHVLIGRHPVTVASVEQLDEKVSGKMRIRFVTPVTTYSTFFHNDRRKTYFYSPWENEFNELIAANALKKYEAFFDVPPKDTRFTLTPIDKHKTKQVIFTFKKTIIKGWLGDFILEGNPELLQLVYDSGIGSKTSNGAGLFTIIEHV